MTELEIAQEKLRLQQAKLHLQQGLPHLPDHGWKLYKWSQDYFYSTKKETFICAANQISKSSTQIRKHIHWATEPALWNKLWLTRPLQFWYLYPTRDVAHIEFKKKWEPEFMPRNEFKEHPQYGWKEELYHSRIFAIHWNSGVSTYFKTYGQDVQDLQTGTVWRMDLDEETPEELMPELQMRLAATDGYLSAVFTPTLGQEFWRRVIEERGAYELFPNAFKRQVSMFDCLNYADGTPSPWTMEKIQRAINSCKSQAEIDRRVKGLFVVDEGLKYPSFSKTVNVIPGHHLPKDWSHWVGVDIGSGGDNHPSAITIIGVSPDFTKARIWRGWRGDGVVTTAGDVVKKVIEMTHGLINVRIFYDHSCRDFYTIATELGLNVEAAEKGHAIGETLLNVLFKNQMLQIYDYPELKPLVVELTTLKVSTPKRKAKDDFIDSARYAAAMVPWNWDAIKEKLPETPKRILTPQQLQLEARRRLIMGSDDDDGLVSVEQELEEWNDLMYGYQEDYYG